MAADGNIHGGSADFAHLHLHTQYSLLDGAIRTKDLCKTVKARGMNAVAVTDHGNMFGALQFYQEAKNAGVKVLGVTDGTSNTVAFSETTLGPGGPNQTGTTGDVRLFYKQVTALTQANCDASTTLVTDRGALWADGAYNGTLYNNVRPPNSPLVDCVQHSNPAWKV